MHTCWNVVSVSQEILFCQSNPIACLLSNAIHNDNCACDYVIELFLGWQQYRTQRLTARIALRFTITLDHARRVAQDEPESVRSCTLSADGGNDKRLSWYETYCRNGRAIARDSDDRAKYPILGEIRVVNTWRIAP
jgi:hypothetical protein